MEIKQLVPTTKKLILGPTENPLMVLEKYPLDFDYTYFSNAYSELFQKSKINDVSTWGYYPELEGNTKEQYPHSHKLGEMIYEHLVSKLHHEYERNLDLAFIKMSKGGMAGSYGGVHLDVTSGIGVYQANEKNAGMDILRIIINLHIKPRILKYIDIPKKTLQKLGVKIDEREYHPINIPKDIVTKILEIPEASEGYIWLVKFWSNIVPHVGLTNECGHFIAGFGQYFDRNAGKYVL